MPRPLPDDVRQAVSAGQKIEAIRLLREHTGLGLLQAKAAVEAGLVPDDSSVATNFAEVPADVAAALASGSNLKAIKLLRETKGLSLKEAKDIVAQASQKAEQQAKRQAAGLSPGEVPRNAVSPSLMVFIAVLVVAAVWFFTSAV